MTPALAIARRELASLFRLPVGWIVIALFLLLTGLVFIYSTIAPGEPATMRGFFSTAAWVMLPLAPAISMRLFSEELRAGTIETLQTAPVSEAAAVLGKYLAAIAFLLCVFLPSLVYPVILTLLATAPGPDLGAIAAGYFGLFLVGCLYLAIGSLASTLTDSQTLAFLGAMVAMIMLMLLSAFVAPRLPSPFSDLLAELSVPQRMADFAKGLLDSRHVVFFIATIAWLLTLSTISLAAKRAS